MGSNATLSGLNGPLKNHHLALDIFGALSYIFPFVLY